MKKRLLVIFLFVMFAMNFTSAIFTIGNPTENLELQYAPSENIKGWINISFGNESSASLFSDSFGNSISLINLLGTDSGYSYSCSTNDCASDYSSSNSASTKSFSLGVGDSKTVGIKFNEDITAVNSINFLVESNANASCFNQLTLDLLANGEIDFGNTKSATGNCEFLKNYGCYTGEETTSEYNIGKIPNKHCQKINLSESPGFKIGAWVNRGSDIRNLTMALYDKSGSPIDGASCNLPNPSLTGETFCEVDYLVTESKEYYVCIYSDDEGTSDIRGYSLSGGCGFYGISVANGDAAFQIFAEGKKFDSVGTLNITNSLPNGNTLGSETEDYIIEKYGSLDCSGGCIVPLKFNSQKAQDITLKNLEIKYETNLGSTTSSNFYDVVETPAKVNSVFQKLFLDGGGFLLPANYSNQTFILSLNGDEIITKKITIEKVPMISYVTPTETASAYPTTFEVIVNASSNISEYKWDFGDNETKTTSENKVIHTYNAIGTYSLKITITDSLQKSSSKTFNISVDSPAKIINKTLIKMQQDLSKIDLRLKEFNLFEQENLKRVLNLTSMGDKLKEAQRDYKAAVSEEDYNKLMGELLAIKIPQAIVTSKSSGLFTFYPDANKVDISALSKITKEDYTAARETGYVEGVFAWNQENLDTKLKFSELSAKYENHEEPILRFFEVNIKKKNTDVQDAYIILKKLDNLKFAENYLENEESGYVYFDLNREEKTLIFSTTSDVDKI